MTFFPSRHFNDYSPFQIVSAPNPEFVSAIFENLFTARLPIDCACLKRRLSLFLVNRLLQIPSPRTYEEPVKKVAVATSIRDESSIRWALAQGYGSEARGAGAKAFGVRRLVAAFLRAVQSLVSALLCRRTANPSPLRELKILFLGLYPGLAPRILCCHLLRRFGKLAPASAGEITCKMPVPHSKNRSPASLSAGTDPTYCICLATNVWSIVSPTRIVFYSPRSLGFWRKACPP